MLSSLYCIVLLIVRVCFFEIIWLNISLLISDHLFETTKDTKYPKLIVSYMEPMEICARFSPIPAVKCSFFGLRNFQNALYN